MDNAKNLNLLVRIINAFDFDNDGPGTDDLIWRTDFDHQKIVVMVNCNDLFAWACADAEIISDDNIDLLEFTIKEVKELEVKLNKDKDFSNRIYIMKYADILWCARYRKSRPQLAYYKSIPEILKPLFDACGTPENQYGSEEFYDRIELETGKKLEWRKKNKNG